MSTLPAVTDSSIYPADYWRIAKVRRVVPVNASTLWRWVRDGKFPRPIKLGPRTTAWRATDVISWIQAKANAGVETIDLKKSKAVALPARVET